jgi:hypothetical protein
MLSMSHLKNFTLAAADGEIGRLRDLYFDDETWTVRYVVPDTGDWLPGRRISPRGLSANGPRLNRPARGPWPGTLSPGCGRRRSEVPEPQSRR